MSRRRAEIDASGYSVAARISPSVLHCPSFIRSRTRQYCAPRRSPSFSGSNVFPSGRGIGCANSGPPGPWCFGQDHLTPTGASPNGGLNPVGSKRVDVGLAELGLGLDAHHGACLSALGVNHAEDVGGRVQGFAVRRHRSYSLGCWPHASTHRVHRLAAGVNCNLSSNENAPGR